MFIQICTSKDGKKEKKSFTTYFEPCVKFSCIYDGEKNGTHIKPNKNKKTTNISNSY